MDISPLLLFSHTIFFSLPLVLKNKEYSYSLSLSSFHISKFISATFQIKIECALYIGEYMEKGPTGYNNFRDSDACRYSLPILAITDIHIL